MGPDEVRRKLSAIFSTDVKGYSRLMGDDEAATVRTLIAYRKIITSLIEEHEGRVVDSPGDNLLAEFASVVNAVQSAVEIQKRLKQENENLPENRRMEFRIGINVGDVIQDGERIYGDGVNIAARLEALAEGGGICISGDAYSQIYTKLNLSYQEIGEQRVKNISRPIMAYKIILEPDGTEGKTFRPEEAPESPKHRRWNFISYRMAGLLFAVLAGLGLIGGLWVSRSGWFSGPNGANPPRTSARASKPVIAVMPFVNTSNDSKQEYYSRGISDDLTATLALFQSIAVLSPEIFVESSAGHTGMMETARHYGARYIIQGNIRRSNGQIRVSARLVEAASGKVLWSKFFDRKSRELLDIEDSIAKEIASHLSIRVTDEEMRRISNRRIKDLDAYELVLKARDLIRRRERKEFFEGRSLLEKALIIDPEYCAANTLLAYSTVVLVDYGWTEFPVDMLWEGEKFAQIAKRKCPSDPEVHRVLALIYGHLGKHDLALQAANFALTLNPNDPALYISRASELFWSGEAKKAIENYEAGVSLGGKLAPGQRMIMGAAYFFDGRLNDAIILLEGILRERPDLPLGHVVLAAAFIKSNKPELARRQIAVLKESNPLIDIMDIGSSLHEKHRAELRKLLMTIGS